MTVQNLLHDEAFKHTEGMSTEEIINYADQVLAIARERAQKDVVQANEVLIRACKLREYSEEIGK